ncbi:MAG: hypothetical protein J6M20_01165 [Clostridia bacterium]|nr:hypothetical protein [Clostridia bacterium]
MMDYEQAVRLTTESNWQPLLLSEKRNVLQVLENRIAATEGRRARNVVLEEMAPGYYGFYNHDDPTNLHISFAAIDDVNDALDTLYHEGRHAYQHDCIDNNTGFPQPILKQFQDGFFNNISPEENYQAYFNNFTEKDARDFSERQCMLLDMEREAILSQNQIETLNSAETMPEMNAASASNHISASYNPAFEQWANETCSWQPEIEQVKQLGASSTANKVYTNREVYDMAQKRFEEDRSLGLSAWGHLSPEQQSILEESWVNEQKCFQALNSNAGPDKEFDAYVGHFWDASDLLRDSCPYEKQLDMPNYSAKKPNESTSSSRKRAVNSAWSREVKLVRDGRGTRNWSVAQQAEMLEYGKVTGFEGSHMMNVKDYPEYAGDPDNIQLMPSIAHFEGVHGGNPRSVNPNGRFDEYTGEVIPAEDGQIPEQPINKLSDKYDSSQEEYHHSTPELDQSGQRRHEDYDQSKHNHPEKSQKIGFRANAEDFAAEPKAQPLADAESSAPFEDNKTQFPEEPNQPNQKNSASETEAKNASEASRHMESQPAQSGSEAQNNEPHDMDLPDNQSKQPEYGDKKTNGEALKETASESEQRRPPAASEQVTNDSSRSQHDTEPENSHNNSNVWDYASRNDASSEPNKKSELDNKKTNEDAAKESEREDQQKQDTSIPKQESDETPAPQHSMASDQSNASGFWNNVPRSSDSTNDQSNTQRNAEQNNVSM